MSQRVSCPSLCRPAASSPQNNPPIFVSNLVGALAACYAKPGDVLFYQEEVATDLYFLVTGKVNLFATFSVRVAHGCANVDALFICLG